MKILLGISGSGMLLGGLYASDALTAGRVYPMPLEQAFAELTAMPVPTALVPAAVGSGASTVTVRRSHQAIDWQFHARGQEVAVFTAHLSPVDPGRTRVRVEFTRQNPPTPEIRALTSATLVRELARLAMSEQVEAQLEDRPVDQAKIADALARHAAAHPEQVEDYGRAVGEMVSGLYSQANDTARDTLPATSGPSLEPVHPEPNP